MQDQRRNCQCTTHAERHSLSAWYFLHSQYVSFLSAVRGGGQIVAPDEEMASAPNDFISRQAQDFSDTYEWGSSWNLDSASSVWIPPIPGQGIVPGTIATWDAGQADFIGSAIEWSFKPHPCGSPDEYWLTGFDYDYYWYMPDPFPGTWPFVIRISQHDPDPWGLPRVGCDWYLLDVEFGALDGQW